MPKRSKQLNEGKKIPEESVAGTSRHGMRTRSSQKSPPAAPITKLSGRKDHVTPPPDVPVAVPSTRGTRTSAASVSSASYATAPSPPPMEMSPSPPPPDNVLRNRNCLDPDESEDDEEHQYELFPVILDSLIPQVYYTIDEILDMDPKPPGVFSVHASATDTSLDPDNMRIEDLVHLQCFLCGYYDSLRRILKEWKQETPDEYLREIRGQEPESITRVSCPWCFKRRKGVSHKMKFYFSLMFTIRSRTGSSIIVHLNGIAASKVLGFEAKEVLVSKENAERVFGIIKSICPETWAEKISPENILNWMIKIDSVSRKQPGVKFYNVMTVTPICLTQSPVSKTPLKQSKSTQYDLSDVPSQSSLASQENVSTVTKRSTRTRRTIF